jgi:hypothetical protein
LPSSRAQIPTSYFSPLNTSLNIELLVQGQSTDGFRCGSGTQQLERFGHIPYSGDTLKNPETLKHNYSGILLPPAVSFLFGMGFGLSCFQKVSLDDSSG